MSKRNKARKQELIRSMKGLEILTEPDKLKPGGITRVVPPRPWWNTISFGLTCGIIAGLIYLV